MQNEPEWWLVVREMLFALLVLLGVLAVGQIIGWVQPCPYDAGDYRCR